jgi:hypothetical protein
MNKSRRAVSWHKSFANVDSFFRNKLTSAMQSSKDRVWRRCTFFKVPNRLLFSGSIFSVELSLVETLRYILIRSCMRGLFRRDDCLDDSDHDPACARSLEELPSLRAVVRSISVSQPVSLEAHYAENFVLIGIRGWGAARSERLTTH